ncbi:MAG TPA: hypothetical protein VI759_06400 [Dehalococcoidia bacterium]|nr:hypothetical protein [Dehalococcoidia bacterium]
MEAQPDLRTGATEVTPRAVILGSEHPRALAVISSLGELGVPIVCVDHEASSRASSSRFVKKTHRISADPAEALAFIVSLGERGGGVLIPTSDEYVILVSQNAELLARHFVLAAPAWDVVGPLIDLARCYALGRECGLKTPKVFKPRDEAELRSIVAGLDLERHAYLLRTPPASVPADIATDRFTKAAGTDAQSILDNCLDIYSRLGEFPIIAEVIPSDADGGIGAHLIVDANHEAVVAYCIRRLTIDYSRDGFTHPYELGAHVYCESVRDEEALEAAKRLARRAGYVGAIAVEFRRDHRDGSLVLVKADVCLARELSLSRAIGLDAPAALYRMLTGGPRPVATTYREGVAWLWLTAYFSTLWVQRSNRPVLRELASTMRRFHRVRALAYWSPRDPMPFFADAVMWLKHAIPRGLRQLFGSPATTSKDLATGD